MQLQWQQYKPRIQKTIFKKNIFDYYIADEISRVFDDMTIIVEEENWKPFVTCTTPEFYCLIVMLAGNVPLKKFKKHKRVPKKLLLPKTEYRAGHSPYA